MKMPVSSAEKAEIFPAFVENSDRNRHLHLLQYNILSMNIKKMSRLLVVSDDIFFNIVLIPPFWLCVLYIFLFDFTDKSYNSTQLSLYAVFVQKRKKYLLLWFYGDFLYFPSSQTTWFLHIKRRIPSEPLSSEGIRLFHFHKQIFSVWIERNRSDCLMLLSSL